MLACFSAARSPMTRFAPESLLWNGPSRSSRLLLRNMGPNPSGISVSDIGVKNNTEEHLPLISADQRGLKTRHFEGARRNKELRLSAFIRVNQRRIFRCGVYDSRHVTCRRRWHR